MAPQDGLLSPLSMQKYRRKREGCSLQGSGQSRRARVTRGTRGGFQRESRYRQHLRLQGLPEQVLRLWCRLQGKEFGEERSRLFSISSNFDTFHLGKAVRASNRLSQPAIRSSLSYASGRRLVDDRPKNPELLNGINKFVEINRLYHVRVHAKLVARHHVPFLT